MKKTIILEELECAHCAAKMEAAVKELPGVEGCSVNFLTQKMEITADLSQNLQKEVTVLHWVTA